MGNQSRLMGNAGNAKGRKYRQIYVPVPKSRLLNRVDREVLAQVVQI